MVAPAKKASPAPVVSFTSTLRPGHAPRSAACSRRTPPPGSPMVTIIRGISGAADLVRARISFSSSGVFSVVVLGEQDAQPPAGCTQSSWSAAKKSRRSTAMLMLDTAANTALPYFSGVLKHPLDDLLVACRSPGRCCRRPGRSRPPVRPAGRSRMAAGPGAWRWRRTTSPPVVEHRQPGAHAVRHGAGCNPC